MVIVFYCLGATGALHHLLCIVGAKLCPSLHRQVYDLPYFGHVSSSTWYRCLVSRICQITGDPRAGWISRTRQQRTHANIAADLVEIDCVSERLHNWLSWSSRLTFLSLVCLFVLFARLYLCYKLNQCKATTLMMMCFIPAVCTSSIWFYYRHEHWAFVLQDILSFSLCVQILSLVRNATNKRAIVMHKQQPCLALLLELYKYIDSCLLLLAVLDHCERLAV